MSRRYERSAFLVSEILRRAKIVDQQIAKGRLAFFEPGDDAVRGTWNTIWSSWRKLQAS